MATDHWQRRPHSTDLGLSLLSCCFVYSLCARFAVCECEQGANAGLLSPRRMMVETVEARLGQRRQHDHRGLRRGGFAAVA